MTIRCITFDLDDTLWECRPVIHRAEQTFYTWLESYYPKISRKYSATQLIEHRIAFMQSTQDNKHDLTCLRKHWLKKLADEAGYNYALVEPGFEVFWLARNDVTLFDEALGVLETLSREYTLGVISNGNADVHHIGIGHLFDFVLSSEKAGVSKPDKDIFHQALALASHQASESVYVGDDPVRDINGAHNAGMKAIWYNPKQTPWPGGQAPDAVIRSLDELQDKISQL
jgi:putative hydrolase of the HAD superfamily